MSTFNLLLVSVFALLPTACVVQTESVSGEHGACWDLNGDGIDDPAEDVNGDGLWDAHDCTGAQGSPGDSYWSHANKAIYYADGNVGIGTPTPTSSLEVIGGASFRSAPDGALSTLGFELTGANDRLFSFILASDSMSGGWDFFSSDPKLNRSLFRIGLNGNVGIGTTTPASTLAVGQLTEGDDRNYSASVQRHGTANSPGSYSSGTPALSVFDYADDGPITQDGQAIAFIAAPRIADNDAHAGNAIILNVANDTGSALTVTGKRSVGIGTATPMATLDVNGTARLKRYGGPPITCIADLAGTIALTNNYRLCVCNSVKWVSTADGTDCQWP